MKFWLLGPMLIAVCSAPASGQPFRSAFGAPYGSNFSNAERLLLFRLGTGRTNYRSFQRYLFAANALQQAETPSAQEINRQRNASMLALRNRQSISSALQTGESASPPPVLANSDIVTVWHTFGLSFNPVDPQIVQAVAPQYAGGLAVAAIAVNGPADKAGWQTGDILIGLYKFQTSTYADVAYVATLPDLASLGPLKAILIRNNKIQTSEITPTNEASMAADATQNEAPAPVGDLPQTQSAESSALSPKEVDIEAQTVWDVIGVRVVPASFPKLESFDRGAKISDIRPDSPAAKAGWNTGDILIGLDAFQMTSLSDLYYVATDPQLDPKTPLPTKILAKGTVQSATIRLAPKP